MIEMEIMVEDKPVMLSHHGLSVETLVLVNDADVRSETYYMDDLGVPVEILANKIFVEEDTDHILKSVKIIRILNVNNSAD